MAFVPFAEHRNAYFCKKLLQHPWAGGKLVGRPGRRGYRRGTGGEYVLAHRGSWASGRAGNAEAAEAANWGDMTSWNGRMTCERSDWGLTLISQPPLEAVNCRSPQSLV